MVEVNLTKKRVFFFLSFVLVVGFAFIVYAVAPNPGHDANGVGAGTFSGTANDRWIIPGKLGIGTSEDNARLHIFATNQRALMISSDTPSYWPSIDVDARDGDAIYRIQVANDGPYSGDFVISDETNEPNSLWRLVIDKATGNVDVKNGLCLGGTCKSSWSQTYQTDMVIVASGSGFAENIRNVKNIGVPANAVIQYCTLVQSEKSGSAVVGCHVYKDAADGEWKVKAYRTAGSFIGSATCRALCVL